MHDIDVAIIGGGQAGLAMSRCLSRLGIDHLVFERGDAGERWRSATWPSLRLLTPNWMNWLPDAPYKGSDPDGFMTRDEFVTYLEEYAASAPVLTRTKVDAVRLETGRYEIATSAGTWRARVVVLATGQCDLPCVPAMAAAMPQVTHLHSSRYSTPEELPPGSVLVVGASSSGIQIADELRRAGREVTLSVGKHIRLPRTWRGEDIFRWLDRIGLLSQKTSEVADLQAAKRQPSLQLVGRPDRETIDLPTLQKAGVRLAGRIVAAEGGQLWLARDLKENVAAAEAKLRRILSTIETAEDRPVPTLTHDLVDTGAFPGPASITPARENIRTIIWATGYRRAYRWLGLPVLDDEGEIAHENGITQMPGVYALGLRFLRRRDSNFIRGAGIDAEALSKEIATYLRTGNRLVA